MSLGLIMLFSLSDLNDLKWTVYGIIGFLIVIINMNYKISKKSLIINFLSFILLLMPFTNRLYRFSSDWFNFPLFYVPLLLFITLYLTSLFFDFKELEKTSNVN